MQEGVLAMIILLQFSLTRVLIICWQLQYVAGSKDTLEEVHIRCVLLHGRMQGYGCSWRLHGDGLSKTGSHTSHQCLHV